MASVEGEKCWVSFRYERPLTFCFQCGMLGHDEKHCLVPPDQQNPRQYGDWLRAQGNSKLGLERSKSTSNGECEGGSDGNTNTTGNFSASSASVDSKDLSGGAVKEKNSDSNEGSTEMHDVRGDDRVQGAVGDPFTQWGRCATGGSESREMGFLPSPGIPRDFGELKGLKEAFSLVGQQAQSVKEQMEGISPVNFNAGLNEVKGTTPEPNGKEKVKKTKAEANWKRIAREKGKNKSSSPEGQPLNIGSKRAGTLVFEKEEIDGSHKRQCTDTITAQNQSDEGSAVAAWQHCREP